MLNKAALKSSIKSLLTSMYDETEKDDAVDKYADELSNAIEAYVKSGEIVYSGGLVAPSGTTGGPVTGSFKINKLQ